MYNVKYINNHNLNMNYELEKNIIINNDLYNEVNKLKINIDDIKEKKWRLIRTLVTDYEFVGNHHYHKIKELHNINPISRAYFKLWELLIKYENYFLFQTKKIVNYVGLAEAPGGFIQSFINYRNNKKDQITTISLKTNKKSNIDFVENSNINITYGDIDRNHDGNLLNPEIIDYFCNEIIDKVNFVTADGGFALNNNKKEMYKGQYHNHLFLCEIYITLRILQNGGNFILKTYDLSNKVTIDLIEILNKVFNIVRIEKPKTSREMNNENYIVCIDYKINHILNKKLFSIINNLWENKNLILTNILKTNNKFLLNNIISIDKYHLYRQIKKLKYALILNDKSEEDLKKILKNKYKYKLSLAYKWIKENKIRN
jgi:23S rRNA U2552 (ribose-2'-O)-methylase RlmE/FtsJ